MRRLWLPVMAALASCSLDTAGIAELDAGVDDDVAPSSARRDAGRDTGTGTARDDEDDEDGLPARPPPASGEVDASLGEGEPPPSASDERDAATRPSDPPAMPPGAAGMTPKSVCPPGDYAVRMELDVAWRGTSMGAVQVIAAGAGTLTVQALARVGEGGAGRARIAPCGIDLPELTQGVNPFVGERYKLYVPEAAWDAPSMPRPTVDWQLGCAEPGCSFGTSLLEGVMGARGKEPFSWPAPSSRSQLTPFDDDGDGKPALSVYSRAAPEVNPRGIPYARVPVLIVGAPTLRISRVMLALGLRAQLAGKVESCDVLSGTTNPGELYGRAYGCIGSYDEGKGPEVACGAEQADTVDQHVPAWTTRSGRFRAVRIAAPTCAAVRAALPVVERPAM